MTTGGVVREENSLTNERPFYWELVQTLALPRGQRRDQSDWADATRIHQADKPKLSEVGKLRGDTGGKPHGGESADALEHDLVRGELRHQYLEGKDRNEQD